MTICNNKFEWLSSINEEGTCSETNKLVEDKFNVEDYSKEQLRVHQSDSQTLNGPSPVKVINSDNQVNKEQMNDIQNDSNSECHTLDEALVLSKNEGVISEDLPSDRSSNSNTEEEQTKEEDAENIQEKHMDTRNEVSDECISDKEAVVGYYPCKEHVDMGI
ncbi:hypothetical protein K7X08_035892 [Anisodus acutangulus]|uniref:Uncharacterized protein n=1 Tax=Anisodus acutangulus TaxID=402998 RepID=A0A9Q1L7A1_9SOLA|nr:hypothetical protein K7X08_035892 [Anisodus acutangulus]